MTDFAFKVVVDAGDANRKLDDISNKLGGMSKQAAESTKILNNKLKDIGKGMGFELARQGLDRLSSSMGVASGAALRAGASGAAMGSTFAGPWGAAIGGAIGLTKGLITGLLDEEKAADAARMATEEQGRAYWEGVKAAERKLAVEASLADTYLRVAENARLVQIAEQQQSAARSADINRTAALQGKISGLEDRIQRLKGMGGLTVATPDFVGSAEDLKAAERELRDAQLELEASTKGYGAALVPILKAENDRKDRITDLEQILGRENLTQEQSRRILKELNTLYRAGNMTLEEYNKKLARSAELKRELKELDELRGRRPLEVEFDQINRGLAGDRISGGGIKGDADDLVKITEELHENAKKAIEEMSKAQQEIHDKEVDAWFDAEEKRVEASVEAADRIEEAWAEGLGSIAADLVNMSAQGELSFEKLGESAAKLALQIAAMQIGGPWGAFLGSFAGGFNLSGHATGAQFMVGGAGGTDQNLVAFRASRDERVTIETPQQVRDGTFRGGGGGGVVINLQNDRRDIVQGMNSRDGEVVFANLERRMRRRRR